MLWPEMTVMLTVARKARKQKEKERKRSERKMKQT